MCACFQESRSTEAHLLSLCSSCTSPQSHQGRKQTQIAPASSPAPHSTFLSVCFSIISEAIFASAQALPRDEFPPVTPPAGTKKGGKFSGHVDSLTLAEGRQHRLD